MGDLLPAYGDRPRLHVRADHGWVNDPNGPVLRDGRLHLFFQHNPGSPVHGDICWGHATSDDLVTWQLHEVALRPTPGGPDAAGCWSGCVVDEGDRLVAVYTGIATGPTDGTVCLAESTDADLRHWTKLPPAEAPVPEGLGLTEVRDPCVVEVDGQRVGVIGAGGVGTRNGHVLLYSCADLTQWSFESVLFREWGPLTELTGPVDTWECPQLFPLDGRWVLVLSPWRDDLLGPVVHVVGDLERDASGLRFVPESCGRLDHGHDFYAPIALVTPDRVLLWGWSWEDRSAEEVLAAGWAGALTLTRELSLVDGRLVSRPVDALEDLRGPALDLAAEGRLPEGPVELLVEASGDLVLDLGGLRMELADGRVRLHREVHDEWRRGWRSDAALPARAVHRLRIVVDGPVVEVYVEDGPCFTERVHAPLTVPDVAGLTVHRLG